MNALQVINKLMDNKINFTYDFGSGIFLTSSTIYDGYMVSIPFERPDNRYFEIDKCIKLAKELNACVGGWFDEKTGKYYLDVSEHIQDLRTALKLAVERGELAIYSFAHDAEIRVPTPQKTGTYTQQATYMKQAIDKLVEQYK